MKTAFIYRSLFLLVFGVLLFIRPVSAEERVREEYESLLEGLTYGVFVNVNPDSPEETSRDGWLSWFKGENLAVRTSFFGGRIRSSSDVYTDRDATVDARADDRFWTGERSIWGGEFGIGYKIGYGIELGISYSVMKVNDWRIRVVQNDPDLVSWYERGSMDIDSRAAMFNTRVYLDDLSGWNMWRFSPYILAGAGRATHRVTDYSLQDDPTVNDSNADTLYNFYTSHNNKGEFAYRAGLGTLFKLTDHISVDASASFMDWGEARASRYNHGTDNITVLRTLVRPSEPDVRTIQGSIGIQFNF